MAQEAYEAALAEDDDNEEQLLPFVPDRSNVDIDAQFEIFEFEGDQGAVLDI